MKFMIYSIILYRLKGIKYSANFFSVENCDIHNDIHIKLICMHAHTCRKTQSLEVQAEAQSTV